MVGSIVNGLLAYVFVVIGTRTLGAEAFAPIAVLWGFWAFSGAALAFPIQHWVIRQIEVDGGPQGVAAALPRLSAAVLAVAGVEGLVAAAFGSRLFGSGSWIWPAAVAGLAVGTGVLGLVRGMLSGLGRFGPAAVVIGGENLVRVVAAVVASVFWASSAGFGAALLTGPLVALGWPGVFRLLRDRSLARPSIRLAGASAMGSVLSQSVLHGGPVALASLGGSPAIVTVVFSTMALFRAPYLIGVGLSLRTTGPVSRWVLDGDRRRVARFGLLIAVSGLVLAGVAALAAWVIGPSLVAGVFGAESRPDAWVAAVVAAASSLALVGLWQFVTLIAAGREASLVASWLIGFSAFALAIALVPGDPVTRVVWAFLTGEASAAAAMATALVTWARRASSGEVGQDGGRHAGGERREEAT